MNAEPFTNIFMEAVDLAYYYSNFTLIDALLSRTDIKPIVEKELFSKGKISLKILQYLEDNGVGIERICINSESNVICELLSDYEIIISIYGEQRCQELCEIIDYLKNRGADTVKAYMALVSAEEDKIWKEGDCFDEVAKRLKPKGGKQWKFRGK
jgi:hypothetical protein